jgi:hypothetical protein
VRNTVGQAEAGRTPRPGDLPLGVGVTLDSCTHLVALLDTDGHTGGKVREAEVGTLVAGV